MVASPNFGCFLRLWQHASFNFKKYSLVLRRFNRGEREMRVSGEEPRGTMGRVQTAGEATSRPLSPSRLPLRAHQKRDVWVRGSGWYIIVSGQAVFNNINKL